MALTQAGQAVIDQAYTEYVRSQYEEYVACMMQHGCDCVMLTFDAWYALQPRP